MSTELIKFNPTKEDVVAMVAEYKELSIKGIDDKVGYQAVHEARMKFKNTRVEITKQGKKARDFYTQKSREISADEKALVALIEPMEKELESKQKSIDEEKIKIKRREVLPERIERLAKIGFEFPEDDLLSMNDVEFEGFFNLRNAEYIEVKEEKKREELIAKELELQAKQDKIDEKERKIAEDKRIEKAEKEAKEQAIKDEKARVEQEEKLEKIRKQEAQEELEKKVKYQRFLKDNGCTKENKDNFFIKNESDKIILYKKVAEFKLK